MILIVAGDWNFSHILENLYAYTACLFKNCGLKKKLKMKCEFLQIVVCTSGKYEGGLIYYS
jgi:hypothetical protein